jgi:fatty-acyl-CoA synthase
MIKKLNQLNVLSLKGVYCLLQSLVVSGINQTAVVSYSAKRYPNSIALKFKDEEYTYKELDEKIKNYASYLRNNLNVGSGKKVALLSSNSSSFIIAFFALSACGADIYLLNSEWSKEQLDNTIKEFDFDFVFCGSTLMAKVTSAENVAVIEISANNEVHISVKTAASRAGKLIVLSSGTTGKIKLAERKASVHRYVFPFLSLIQKLPITQKDTVLISTPLYHGYGIATMLMSFFLGVKVCVNESYSHFELADIIEKEEVSVLTLVPLTLQRLLLHSPSKMKSIQCVLSGGAPLSESQLSLSQKLLGDKLFNLYGTSEAGFTVMANPTDLRKFPSTIGKELKGVKVKIEQGEMSEICFKNSWSRRNKKSAWVNSGDLGYRNSEGYLFVKGRVDDMIVSGGQNVYPYELERVLLRHEDVCQAYVYGVKDDDFGQRLKAKVVVKSESALNEAELFDFLKDKIAKFHKPASIELVDEINVSSLGKIIKEKFPQS